MGGIETVRLIHHLCAVILILGAVYHGVSLFYKVLVLRIRWTIFPQLQDVRDALNAVSYNLGLRKEPPKYDHFSFSEKVEYWALVWGTVIMALTGFMLWNPIIATRILPGEWIPTAKAAHGAEAILAVLAILVWHLYNVHIKTLNKAMFTGKLPEHAMAEEHALELERLARGETAYKPEPAVLRRRQRIFVPSAVVVSLTLLLGVFLFTTAETTAVTTLPKRATVQVYVPQTPTPMPTRPPTNTPTNTPTPVIVEATPTSAVVQATPSGAAPLLTPTAVVQVPPTQAVAAAPPIPANHTGRTVCQVCHASGVGGAPKNPPDHAGRLDATCTDCHKPK
jgi:cytochrome b subunit of formate dehydrogenase